MKSGSIFKIFIASYFLLLSQLGNSSRIPKTSKDISQIGENDLNLVNEIDTRKVSLEEQGNDTFEDFSDILNNKDEGTSTITETGAVSVDEYFSRRNALLEEEADDMLGSNLRLTSRREQRVNDILMKYKQREYSEGLDGTNGEHFAGAKHFFHAREEIKASNVFKIIKLFPKGCALHLHDSTTGSVEWVARNLTFWPNLYMCFQEHYDNQLIFRFADSLPTGGCNADPSSNWMSVADFRNNASSYGYVEKLFIDHMTLYTQTPELKYRDNNGAWYYFSRTIETTFGIVGFVDAMKAYYIQTLQEFYDDNVMYVENRGLLEYIYRLDQSLLSPEETLSIYEEATAEFAASHPKFWGAKFIITPIRVYPQKKMGEMVQTAIQLKQNHPVFFAGFDIVSHEDVGMPNIEYISQLLDASNAGLKFFFHAGESNWHGTKIDDNILDAILLNTTRIGHGTALNGRPYLTQKVCKKDIGVEVSPISGQVLKLAGDFRTHPVVPWLRKGFPIVIASDNPGMWGATGLSYDWYIAFMAMAGQRADLRFLKQLALNSIEYSAMSRSEKLLAKRKWAVSYALFLNKVIAQCENGCP